jgi:ribosomal protein S18 acetylase RimI-like enzyme
MSPVVTQRAATPEDREFLYRLFASSRLDVMQFPGWSDAQREVFLRVQFQARGAHYAAQFPHGDVRVVERDGAPVGSLHTDRTGDDLRLVDLAIVPEQRGAGLGTEILRGVLEDARALGKRVVLHVEVHNRAARLYARVGFTEVANDGIYRRMQWSPSDL